MKLRLNMAHGARWVPHKFDPLDLFLLALSHLDLSQHEELFLGHRVLLGGQEHTLSSLTLFIVVQTHSE